MLKLDSRKLAPGRRVDKPRSRFPALIEAGLVVRGSLHSGGVINVDGVVIGDISAKCVVIERDGRVDGEIQADEVVVSGSCSGRITARAVSMHDGAEWRGVLTYETLLVECGVEFEGVVAVGDGLGAPEVGAVSLAVDMA